MQTICTEVNNFVEFLKSSGYSIESNNHDIEEFKVLGNNILGYFSMHGMSHPCEYFRFAFDNVNCYNKIGQCPVSYDILSDDLIKLNTWLDFVGSNEGLEWSRGFEYLDDDSRPMIEYK